MLGYWVGMSTHEVGWNSDPLRAGLVCTIEPAFQGSEGQINLRCEDLIVIMESDAEILPDFVLFTVDQIEKPVTGAGSLQNYLRSKTVAKEDSIQELCESRHTTRTGNFEGVRFVA
jgi:hypothetical protein